MKLLITTEDFVVGPSGQAEVPGYSAALSIGETVKRVRHWSVASPDTSAVVPSTCYLCDSANVSPSFNDFKAQPFNYFVVLTGGTYYLVYLESQARGDVENPMNLLLLPEGDARLADNDVEMPLALNRANKSELFDVL